MREGNTRTVIYEREATPEEIERYMKGITLLNDLIDEHELKKQKVVTKEVS